MKVLSILDERRTVRRRFEVIIPAPEAGVYVEVVGRYQYLYIYQDLYKRDSIIGSLFLLLYMRDINNYILEKLHLNKNVNIDKVYLSIIYSSSSFKKSEDLEKDIKNKTYIKKIIISQEESSGVMYNFNISIYNKEDFLELIIYLYNRISPQYAKIDTELDDWLKKCIKGYTRNIKQIVHDTFTDKEIKDAQIRFLNRGNY